MSYIAFDLDALNVVPDVAAVAGVSPAEISYGLARLWAWCFRQSKAHIQTEHIAAFFGGRQQAEQAATALELFGFIERTEDGFRVRGADRYLRVREARVLGGKKAAAKGNLKRGSRRPAGAAPQLPPSSSPAAPGAELQLLPSPTPNTEHRAPNIKEGAPRKSAPQSPEGFRQKTDALSADFAEVVGEKYLWGGERDTNALKRLLSTATLEEVRARWRKGLELGDRWPGVRTVGQLALRWNDLGSAPNPTQQPQLEHLG